MINTIFDTKTVKNNEIGLDTEEKKARLTIIEEMANQDQSIDIRHIDLDLEIINSLSEKGMIVLDENKKKVIFAYPVSGEHTSHEIHLADGRVFHSMCAIDSLGSSFTFGQDLTIKSKCSTSGDPLEIVIKDKQIENTNIDDIYVIHVDLNEEKDWFSSC